jgi:hypothetical protein
MISKVDPILGFFELTFRGSKAVRDMRLCLQQLHAAGHPVDMGMS